MRPKLTYANVIATLALFVALGGSGYAAITLPKNSVGAKQIRKNAVTTKKVKNKSLLRGDFKAGQLNFLTQGAADGRYLARGGTAANADNASNASNAANADRLDGIDSSGFVSGSGQRIARAFSSSATSPEDVIELPGYGQLTLDCGASTYLARFTNTTSEARTIWLNGVTRGTVLGPSSTGPDKANLNPTDFQVLPSVSAGGGPADFRVGHDEFVIQAGTKVASLTLERQHLQGADLLTATCTAVLSGFVTP